MLTEYLDTMIILEFPDVIRVPTQSQQRTMSDRLNSTYQSSEAIPKSLQHRIKAFDFAPSCAVEIPDGSKYSCSPLATATNLAPH